MDNKIVLAIIGASIGQKKLYEKAHEMGIYVIGFSWPVGAVCRDLADKFYPISILEKDRIVEICRIENVKGVVSNASDITAEIVSYVSEQLGLHGNSYSNFLLLKNKFYVRSATNNIEGLHLIDFKQYDNHLPIYYPCVVKPTIGSAKKGVSFVSNEIEFLKAIEYSKEKTSSPILIESYIKGEEVSVESISFEGQHYVIQITDKDSTGAPHFVELGHHQPSSLNLCVKQRIKEITKEILTRLHFMNGASHIELKVDETGEIFLIEVNPRGAGGEISNQLVFLSTGYDYMKGMISVSLGSFEKPVISEAAYAGIYFLCEQTKCYLSHFIDQNPYSWLYDKSISSLVLNESKSNYDRNGYLIYKWWKKLSFESNDNDILTLNKLDNKYDLAVSFVKKINTESNNNLSVDWVNKILRNADIQCVMQSGHIVAWIVLYCNDYQTKKAYCAGLHVLSEYRRHGYAQNLLNAAIFICQQRHFKELTLYCNNPIAERLYEKNGFTFVRKELVPNLHNKEYNFFKLLIS